MEVLLRNAEGNLTQNDRDYAAKKLGHLDHYFHQAQKVEIVHRESKQGHRIEVTVFADGLTVRGEETDTSLRAAIDLVGTKIEFRLRRLKKKIVDRYRHAGHAVPRGFQEPEPEETNHKFEIKERKHFLIKPMEPEEAALEMDLIDHPFFVFKNEDTDRIEVLYKRKDGSYGLLQPEA